VTLIVAYASRGLSRDITIQDADEEAITPTDSDVIRAIIGRQGETAMLTVTSVGSTANGSSFTKGATNRLRLDAADLTFDPGTYTLWIDMMDAADASEWKRVEDEVFVLKSGGRIVDLSEVLLELGLSGTITDEEMAVSATALERAEAAVCRFLQYDPFQQERTEFYPQATLRSSRREGVWEVANDQAVLRQLSEASTDELQLRHIPIRSISSLRIDYDGRAGTQATSFAAETEKVEGTDFWPNYTMFDSASAGVCFDGILRSVGLWPVVAGTVRVTYTAGYSQAELHGQDMLIDAAPIGEAIVRTAVRNVRRMFAAKKHTQGWIAGTITGERLGDYNYTVDPYSAKSLLDGAALTSDIKELLNDFVNYGWQL